MMQRRRQKRKKSRKHRGPERLYKGTLKPYRTQQDETRKKDRLRDTQRDEKEKHIRKETKIKPF
jgi:hypothetical protein